MMNERDINTATTLPAHLVALAAKLQASWDAPEATTAPAEPPALFGMTTEVVSKWDSVNEGRTILRGTVAGAKRAAIERQVRLDEQRLAGMMNS